MFYPSKLKLWPHQAEAADKLGRYFDSRLRSKTASAKHASALVNIPTGGGKTAVIAAVAHWHPRVNRALVLAPRAAIRDQLLLELSASRGHLLRVGLEPSALPKTVHGIRAAGQIPDVLPGRSIFVSTIQLVHDVARDPNRKDAYLKLVRNFDAIFVDEGHYEPAKDWSTSIRDLKCPIALVTATPYRNDLKQFDLDPEYLHVSRYTDLMNARVLRHLQVTQQRASALQTPREFVNSVLATFVREYGEPPTSKRKLIIRCKSQDAIRHIGDAARSHRLGRNGVLCFHENFQWNPDRPWELRQPQDPESPDAPAVWIHQHKLLEGVDGPSFRAVAFYGVLGSARSLVQQIGRVLRNPTKARGEVALLIDHSEGRIAGMWERFLAYDKQVSAESLLEGLNEVSAAYDRALPAIVYADRQFRQRLIFETSTEEELRKSLRLPMRCQLWALRRGESLSPLASLARNRLMEEDYTFRVVTESQQEVIILFAKHGTSALLEDHYFVERELHALVAYRARDVVAVMDTSGSALCAEAVGQVGSPLTRTATARLLTGSPSMRLTEVAARNAALGPFSVRRRSTWAASLSDTPPAIDEFQYVASAVTAVDRAGIASESNSDKFSVRSIGFGRARVSDSSGRVELPNWQTWAHRLIDQVLDDSARPPAYLDRFARPLDSPPTAPLPKNILIDVHEARHEFVVSAIDETDATAFDMDDTCVDCARDPANPDGPRTFRVTANGIECAAHLEYQADTRRYLITSSDLENRYRYEDRALTGNLVKYLNDNQAFVVIPESPHTIYAEGAFYNPRLRTGRSFDPKSLGLSAVLTVHTDLHACVSEKGDRASATPAGWATDTVFNWIDANCAELLDGANLILCDDGKNECCDFILAGRRGGRDVVVMAHAKGNRQPSVVSAKSLHEVCSQASKQVGTLAPFSPIRPAQVARWSTAWQGPNGEGRVDRRIRRARGAWAGLSGAELWKRLEEILQRPNTEREVVLVLGGCLRRDQFFTQCQQVNTPAPAIHVLYLLRSTLAAVMGVGAKLRILCG